MGTLIGVMLIGALLGYTIYDTVPSNFFTHDLATGRTVALSIAIGFLVVYASLLLWLMNKPSYVDFLIATDSEMKKVNWTSRKELIGSSKVVILFMFMIAIYLFANDILFGYIMYFINVLKSPPFK